MISLLEASEVCCAIAGGEAVSSQTAKRTDNRSMKLSLKIGSLFADPRQCAFHGSEDMQSILGTAHVLFPAKHQGPTILPELTTNEQQRKSVAANRVLEFHRFLSVQEGQSMFQMLIAEPAQRDAVVAVVAESNLSQPLQNFIHLAGE